MYRRGQTLNEFITNLQLVSQEQKIYMKGILLMPGYMSKGFEFTTVVVADADHKNYSTDLDAYFLYTMTSRATRKLFVFYTDILAPVLQLIDRSLYKVVDMK